MRQPSSSLRALPPEGAREPLGAARRSPLFVWFANHGGIWPVVGLLVVWELMCLIGLAPARLLPSPLAVGLRLAHDLPDPDFLFHIGQTLIRLFAGFFIALALGLCLGIAMAQGAEPFLTPLVRVASPIPKIALYPVLVLLLGYGHAPKIALVVADAVFPLMLATLHGLRSVPPKLVWAAQAAGAGRAAIMFTVMLPSALGPILTGCRIGLVIACINVFLAEMISSSDGLGHLLVTAARSYQVVDMFVPLVLISLIGLALNASLQFARRRLPAAP
jgi:ABC-type nitrate/sulfonate/bicarbonate transport system permease component